MNLGAFHDRVSQAIKRGTSLDTIIPFWVADAARLIETNYTFSWMKKTTDYTIAQANAQMSIALSPLVKSIFWARPILDVGTDGTVALGDRLIGVEEEDVTAISSYPLGYWIDGADGSYTMKFDAAAVQEFKVRVRQAVYTDWPTNEALTPTLLARGQSLLFFQTLVLYANEQKDAAMAAQYLGMMQGANEVLLKSEEELKMQHQGDLAMTYQGLG